jgi:RNA polymerase sigma-70 factor (ECF subfamily)
MEAFGMIFDRHWRHIWRAAYGITRRRDLADEVAQEAFIRAASALPRFDTDRPILPWLTRIATNHAIDIMRRESRSVPATDPVTEPERHEEGSLHDVEAALEALPPERRAVVVLRFHFGYTLNEISRILDVAEGTVASRLSRGLGELRTRLSEEGHRA